MDERRGRSHFSAGREALVRRWWAGELDGAGRVLSLLTWPAEMAFRTGVVLRNAAYDRGLARSRRAPIPVISVGNLTVGGTGKTPFSGWLVATLQALDSRPALVTRGYGADEVALHRRWNPEVPVHVAPRRFEGVVAAAEGGAWVAVVDDGFQHRGLARDLDLVLVAAEESWPPRLLPRGPYREPLSHLRRADLVVVTRRTASRKESEAMARELAGGRPVVRLALCPGGWLDLTGEPAAAPDLERGLVAVSSIARPEAFRALVQRVTGRRPDLIAFPDHHAYAPADARAIASEARGRPVITTEKDAVKLLGFRHELAEVRVLPLEVRMEEGEETLMSAVEQVVAGPT